MNIEFLFQKKSVRQKKIHRDFKNYLIFFMDRSICSIPIAIQPSTLVGSAMLIHKQEIGDQKIKKMYLKGVLHAPSEGAAGANSRRTYTNN
jgi:hypothetical protein